MNEEVNKDAKPVKIGPRKSDNARNTLGWAMLFLGELRDGLTMINMQSAYLITSKGYSEKQAGTLFFVFGISQFLFQTPAGYVMDYSDKKVLLLSLAAIGTTVLTIITAIFAEDEGANLGLMVLVKFLQGGITALIPPGLNSITQGIVGTVGMTQQVSRNEMMNHIGTAVIVFVGSILAFFLYPNIGPLFVVSPIACVGVVFFLMRIKPHHIDHNAARGLSMVAEPDGSFSVASKGSKYIPPVVEKPITEGDDENIQTSPSFNIGFNNMDQNSVITESVHAETPLGILRDTTLFAFTLTVFLFHTSNGCVLPLTMQSLALEGGRSGILMSGLCIILAQSVMVGSAKVCGDYSSRYGRKPLFLLGLFSVSLRCAILVGLVTIRDNMGSNLFVQTLILSTQILDGVGAGIFGTMYVLVTSDISKGTGRFSLTLGITTAAMSIGGTISGYLGEMLAEDFGYRAAFGILGIMSLVPALLYLVVMPETLSTLSTDGYAASPSNRMASMNSLASIREGKKEDDTSEKGSSVKYAELV